MYLRNYISLMELTPIIYSVMAVILRTKITACCQAKLSKVIMANAENECCFVVTWNPRIKLSKESDSAKSEKELISIIYWDEFQQNIEAEQWPGSQQRNLLSSSRKYVLSNIQTWFRLSQLRRRNNAESFTFVNIITQLV